MEIADFPVLQSEPSLFVSHLFKESLWQKQEEILASVRDNRVTTVKSAHAIGKSFISARAALWFLYTHRDSIVITTAPSFRQVEDILWREIRTAKGKSTVQLKGSFLTTKIDISPSWFALGLSTNEPDRFQGYHKVDILLIIDEAAGVKEDIYEASEGIVSSANARILYIGNPTNISGTFYKSFNVENTSKISISAFDTPNFTEFGITLDDIRNNTWERKIDGKPLPRPYLITPEWVYDKFVRWGEGTPMWDSRIMARFPEQGEDTLIRLVDIEAAIAREVEVKLDAPEVIGVDVARFGSDKTIFVYRKGPRVIDIQKHEHMDTMTTAQKAAAYAEFYPATTLNVDIVGVGGGTFDRLVQIMNSQRIIGIGAGESANDKERFANKRAEMYWGLRERFIQGDISIPNDEELIAQLSNIKYKFTPKGQILIESKEDMKKRGLPSPDKADALAMSFATGANVYWQPVSYAKPSLDSSVQNTQSSGIIQQLKDEDQRKKLELEADMAIMKLQRGQNMDGSW